MPRRPFDPGRPRQPLRAKAKKDENLGTRQAPRRLLNFKLDWQAYFRRFAGHHGGRHGNGVEISGRLVFEDGWAYSATSYQGPEWRPPADPAELRALLAAYWRERRGIVADELKLLVAGREALKDSLVKLSLPLMRRVRRYDETKSHGDPGWCYYDAVPLEDLAEFDERIAWLAADLEECETKIEELSDEQTTVLSGVAERSGGPADAEQT